MPYGIEGKTKEWEETTEAGQEIDKKIESCVNDLMADPNFKPKDGKDKKSAAIAVCKARIAGSNKKGRENYKVPKEAIV